MKSKTKTYLLLFVVLAIWGILGFKITSTLKPNNPELGISDNVVLFAPQKSKPIDTFSIQTSTRDPFLGTLYIKKKHKVKPPKAPKEKLIWIPVVYHGTIAKQQSKNQVFIISINEQQHLMKIGQEINDVKLIKANNNTIFVSYKGDKKSIDKI